MDAKARQDCIKEIDLLKVKNQRGGRRRHAPCSVLLRCLSWDLPPKKNNWCAPDCLDFGSGVWGYAHCARLLAWIWMQRSILCTLVRILVSVCVCACVCCWTSVTYLQAHIDFFFKCQNCCCFFFLFLVFLFYLLECFNQGNCRSAGKFGFSHLMFHLLPFHSLILLFLFWRKWFHLSNCHKTSVRWVALKY